MDTRFFRSMLRGAVIAGMALSVGVAMAKPDGTSKMPGKRPPDYEVGKKLWAQSCWQCHGEKGMGDGPAAAAMPDTEVAGDPTDRLPHLVTFSCLYVDGEALVTALDAEGFGVASGSACAASTLEPSAVLAAMGVLTHGNVRVSLTRDTTAEEVERFCVVLPRVVERLRSEVGL